MYSIKKLSKYILAFSASLCLMLLGICCFYLNSITKVYADSENQVSYFVAKNGDKVYNNNSTVFLNASEVLNVTLGKPSVFNSTYQENGYLSENNDELLIGDYAVSLLNASFNLKINGENISNTSGYFETTNFKYISNSNTSRAEEHLFSFFEMNIDLSSSLFEAGEYVISFYNYFEYSGTDYGISSQKTFSITFYIFNTTDYFETESLTSANVTFENTNYMTPVNASYRNYHYFNYTNYISSSKTENYLPSLSFDASKYNVSLTKTISGINSTAKISKFLPNYVNLTNATKNFFTLNYDNLTDKFEIVFNDIGDYKISYEFIYQNEPSNYVVLSSNEISVFETKLDVVYMFGYQMFYSGNNETPNNEFKFIENGQASGTNSADVSYMLPKDDLIKIAKQDSNDKIVTEIGGIKDNGDAVQGFINEILAKTPASTNQPAITTKTNATLIENCSYYYTLDKNTNSWAINEDDALIKTPYVDNPFTTPGTYLLKVVYSFNNYLPDYNQYFTQFFYFNISNTIPSLTTEEIFEDNSTQVLSSNAFTNKSVKLTLAKQSIFNSPVKVEIYAKGFNANQSPTDASTYPTAPNRTLTQNQNTWTYAVTPTDTNKTYNRNYMVKLIYGNNGQKVQTSYFTIDDTNFENVNAYPVELSATTTQSYVKITSNPIEFFTNSKVSVEWKEKTSGAKSYAYYKYIPFKQVASATKSPSAINNNHGIATNYALDFDKTASLIQSSYNNTYNYKSLLTSDMVFSNQGMYILYIYDEAGNSTYKTFCIDQTDIVIWQLINNSDYVENVNVNNNLVNYNDNVVSSERVTLQWGRYKFIKLNITKTDIEDKTITDKWALDVFTSMYDEYKYQRANPTETQQREGIDADIFENNTSDLFFAVKIAPTMVIQSGNSYNLIKSANAIETKTTNLVEEISGYRFVKELTYIYYLIDESNIFYDSLKSLENSATNAETTSSACQNYILNSSVHYSLTTSSDASNAMLLVNNSSTGLFDTSLIDNNSVAFSQAGFTDSKAYDAENDDYNLINNLRTKYYITTGSTNMGDINLLSYIYKSTTSMKVASVQVLYYPFEIIGGVYKLSETAFDISSNLSVNTLSGNYNNYFAFNINPYYDLETNTYKTLDGKYVIIRTYADTTAVQNYDFEIRESVIIVDREDIVSNPDNETNKSYVGGDIFIQVPDDTAGEHLKFTNIYASKNNDSAILKTNKLPVVVYIPIAKFGYENSANANNYKFNLIDNLQYYYNAYKEESGYYLTRYSIKNAPDTEKSILGFSYFGDNAYLTTDFASGDAKKTYRNSSFDLTLKITDNSGNSYVVNNVSQTSENYLFSTNLTKAGIYTVEIIQNAVNGIVYPNAYNNFKFTFQIIENPPAFEFVKEDNSTINQDNYSIYYTNESLVKVVWTDPTSKYLSKIDRSKIYYYINGKDTTKTYVSTIETDEINTNKHWFTLDTSTYPSGTIISVYMQYNGEIQTSSTKITKRLYIDKTAPESVLNELISYSSIDGNSIAKLSREYLDVNSEAILTENLSNIDAKMYNCVKTSGTLANYYFAYEYNASKLTSLLSTKTPITGVDHNSYYANGYYYYAKEINLNSAITKINFAKNPVSSHKVSVANMLPNRYYEIIEMDLAGNISIYILFLANPNETDNVMTFEKENTTYNTQTSLEFGDLEVTQNIFAKSYFNIQSLNLYNNNWLFFKAQVIDGNNYTEKYLFKAPNLNANEFYDFSTWTNTDNTSPQIIIIDKLKLETAGKYNLVLNNCAMQSTSNYEFKIYVTNSTLDYYPLDENEGISIIETGNENEEIGNEETNDVWQYPSSIKIYSYENYRYNLIYDFSNFVSTNAITYTKINNNHQFLVNAPKNAYKYEFIDNYGINYVEYHTVGEIKLTENEKVLNFADEVVIKDTDGTSNSWYVGLENMVFNYSASEYTAYIKTYYLEFDALLEKFVWKEYIYTSGNISTYGCELINGMSTPFFSVADSMFGATINEVTLKAQSQIANLTTYTGNIVKAIITLENKYETSSSAVKIERLLINNLTPNIKLLDKNGEDKTSLLDGSSLYSGQISIKYSFADFESNFAFPFTIKMIYNNGTPTTLSNGTIISNAGTYILKTYTTIDGADILIDTHTIRISDSSNDFFTVEIFSDENQVFEIVNTTGNLFKYFHNGNWVVCYNHYIVNTNNYRINLNENEGIVKEVLVDSASLMIYRITNQNSSQLDIRPYTTIIAISYIEPNNSLLANSFGYDTDNDKQYTNFTNTASEIIITTANPNFSDLVIKYNSYYSIPENTLTPIIYFGENAKTLYEPKITTNNGISTFTIAHSGYYTIYFKDLAGNKQLFYDSINSYSVNAYTIVFVKGVAYEINGETPIQNGIYNDSVTITLPDIMSSVYDYSKGGKPLIHATKNGKELTLTANEQGAYVITGAGYYKVYFDAEIGEQKVRQEIYEFTIIASKEYKSSFNFSEFGDYRITKLVKNGVIVDYSNYFDSDENGNLKSISISLYDEITGAGSYSLTIKTNSAIEDEEFTFNFIIKNIGIIPIKVSIAEGKSTTDNIIVKFNAYDLYNDIGECSVICGDTTYFINEEYIASLERAGSYYQTCKVTETGTHFVQVYSSSDKLLYSYKVIKTEPLNAVSIILIVVGVVAVAGLALTITLLRRRMKIR